jgi:hypothetical protein
MTTARPLGPGSRLRSFFVWPVHARWTSSIEPAQDRSTDPRLRSSAAPLNQSACVYSQKESRNIIAFKAKTQFFAGTKLDNRHSGSRRSSEARKNARSSDISLGGLPKRIATVQ